MIGILKRGRSRLVIGVSALVVLIVVASVVVYQQTQNKNTTIYALTTNASPLVVGNMVKVDGIKVGQISSIQLEHNRVAKVGMNVEKSILPLHQDASFTIKPVSLLGERYVALNTGSPDKRVLAAHQPIPANQTHQSVDLDQVLDSLNNPTSASLAALVTTLGEGTAGQGQNIDGAIKALAPTMTNTQKLGSTLDQQNDVLKQLLTRITPVTNSLSAQHGQKLDQLVGSARQSLATVSDQRQALDATVKQLPSTLQQSQRTLAQVAGISQSGTATLKGARPVTDKLPQITDELNGFANAGDPALASMPPVLDKAKGLLDQAGPVVHDLGPGAAALPSVGNSAHTLVGNETLTGAKLTTVLDFLKFWALSTNGRDSVSNYFRGVVPDTPGAIAQFPAQGIGQNGNNGPPAPGNPAVPMQPANPGNPAQPEGPYPQQDANKPPNSGIPTINPPPNSAPGGDSGSATGLTNNQENSMLTQLLGGS